MIPELEKTYKETKLSPCILVNLEQKAILCRQKDSPEVSKGGIRHSVLNCIDDISKVSQQEEKPSDSSKDNYLLYGMTMVCLHEPCLMCSMALVHSRLKNLVYFRKGAYEDCPFSNDKINFLGLKLNHKFQVFVLKKGKNKLVNLLSLKEL